MWTQRFVRISPKSRGFHIIDQEIYTQLPELKRVEIGLLHLFIQHTSASLSLNENADPSVRTDLESHLNYIIPENASYFRHTYEGPDDMPAHIKASLLGNSVTVPINKGQLQLGTWQGIYLGEHRNNGGPRTIVATLHGTQHKQ